MVGRLSVAGLGAVLLFATILLAVCASDARADSKEVTFAYQDMVVPLRVLMDDGAIEKATGYKINWRKFGGGGDVIRAMASGNVQIGEAGSSPIAAAASQGVDIELFWILDDIANAEQLVARDGTGITSVKDLRGRTVATPFVSTSHYQLMYALKNAGLGPSDVRVLNMRPPEIAAAWERGDIDATFIWDPVLAKVKQNGKVIASAGDIARAGQPTFDGIVVNRAWAEANKPFLIELVRLLAAADERYRGHAAEWTPDSTEVKSVAKLTGATPSDVPSALASYRFPTLAEQVSVTWLGGGAAKALADTSGFLAERGRVPAVLPDYSRFVTDEYVKAAEQRPD